jgi:hypothetical protein
MRIGFDGSAILLHGKLSYSMRKSARRIDGCQCIRSPSFQQDIPHYLQHRIGLRERLRDRLAEFAVDRIFHLCEQ